MVADARRPVNVMRLAVLVAVLVLGGAAPALAQSAASEDDPYDPGPSDPPSISVVKTASPTAVPEPGGEVTFSVVVKHDTPDAGAVQLRSLVDDVHGVLDGRGTCTLPQTIEPGTSYACAFTAFVGGQPGDVETDTVFAAGVDPEGRPVHASDEALVSVTDVPSALSVDKQATPGIVPSDGAPVTFSVHVTNDSAVDAVTVEQVMDDVFGDVGDTCEVALPHTLAPGESFVCGFEDVISGVVGKPHVNVVTVSGTDDDGNAVSAEDAATVEFEPEQVTDPLIDLELEQGFSPDSVSVGGHSVLRVRVENQGPADATGIVVTEALPDGVAYVSDDGSGAYDPGSGLWTVGALGAGESAVLEITTSVDEAGEHRAVAEVTAADQTDADSVPADGTGDDWDDAAVGATAVLATSSLGDTVWADLDADGAMDDDELGLSGAQIRLTMPDGSHRWLSTGPDGRYLFVGLAAGEYRVRVYAPDGWVPTTASSMRVTLNGDDVYLGADFGLARALPLTGMDLGTIAWLGTALTVAGAGLLILGRRRRGERIPAI